jgi:hypothetical protein
MQSKIKSSHFMLQLKSKNKISKYARLRNMLSFNTDNYEKIPVHLCNTKAEKIKKPHKILNFKK